MNHKILLPILLFFILIQGIAFAAKDIIPYKDGYVYTDSMRSKIYFYNGELETLLTGPGVGYYYTFSPNQTMLGFKLRDMPGGLEAPAYLNMETRKITVLHEPVSCAGQVYFSAEGDIAYTIGNTLFIKKNNLRISYDLGNYANIVPISPDAEWAIYNEPDDQLWIINLQNSTKQCITQSRYGNVMPAWSPNSKYISYSSLDGNVKIYDISQDKTINLGQGSNLRWSDKADEFVYTRIDLDDKLGIINTDIVVSDVSGIVRFDTQTPDIMETNGAFLPDGSIMYMQNGIPVFNTDNTSMQKQSTQYTVTETLPTAPVFFEQKVPAADSYLDVPYIHQVYDTPGPRGYSSCAPTTAAMVLAYYQVIPQWPFLSGFGHWNDYAAYIHERYYYNGNNFDLTYVDCNSSGSTCYTCYGGMGYMWTGGSPNSRMLGYYNKHGVSGNQTWSTSWSTVSAEIDKQQPFSICNFLSGGGHLIVGIGRGENGQRTVIANDPYGNKNTASWPSYDGKVVYYDWPGYNHGHVSLNDANSGYTSMPWCIATCFNPPALIDSIVDDKEFTGGFYMKAYGNTIPMRYYHSENTGYGGHHWWSYTEITADICYVTWSPQLSEGGYYEIKAYIPDHATATTASYIIRHAAGESVALVNQNSVSDDWVSLGKYLFTDDGLNSVYLGDSTGIADEIIAYDAMKWEHAAQNELDFTADYTLGMPNYNITFSAVSELPEGEYQYTWDFGDGLSGSGEILSHYYQEEGLYTVVLTAEASGVEVSVSKKNYIVIISNTKGDFALISPDSMEIVHSTTPRLMWESVPNAEWYYIYIGETLDFSIMQPIECDTNWIRINDPLPENKTIYWHVKAVTSVNDTLASTFWRFQVNSENTAPAVFELICPEHESIHDTLRPVFSWGTSSDEDPQDTITYELYIGTDPDSMYCMYTGSETYFQPQDDLKENGRYRWYVMAVDASDAKTRSREAYRNYAINAVNEAPPPPVQLAPLHNSYQTTRYPRFEWTAVRDPDPGDEITYKVYYWFTGSSTVYLITTKDTYHDQRRLRDQSEYFWTVAALDDHNLRSYSDTLTVYIDSEMDVVNLPLDFALNKNYPNPFNPATHISYTVPYGEQVKIFLYDISGKMVHTLVDRYHVAGYYQIQFNASCFPGGVYIYTMQAGEYYASRKMVLMK
ncbi:MAG: PKD domain-containing protein [Candidatus Marinimicrobia bacterium]|nr:PKD domain-containing protein [Candidatus Neomarinimicrobiota bacterium]